jgi:hypothetical protein
MKKTANELIKQLNLDPTKFFPCLNNYEIVNIEENVLLHVFPDGNSSLELVSIARIEGDISRFLTESQGAFMVKERMIISIPRNNDLPKVLPEALTLLSTHYKY